VVVVRIQLEGTVVVVVRIQLEGAVVVVDIQVGMEAAPLHKEFKIVKHLSNK
jgi:hypothetical protein